MGKAVGGVPGAPALSGSDPPPAEEAGIGAYLARQRRLRGIDLDELAALTRIPRRSLERLEAGAFDGPPDGFARGFVRTVALALGLDPEDAVSRMLREPELPYGRRLPNPRRVAAAGGVLLLLLGLVAGLVRLGGGETAAPAPERGPELPERRDHVRALAEEVGALPATPLPADAAEPVVPVDPADPADPEAPGGPAHRE